jgi:hypothetical protein
MSTKFSSDSLKVKGHLEDVGIDEKNIENGSERHGNEGYRLESSGSEQGQQQAAVNMIIIHGLRKSSRFSQLHKG